MVGWYHTGPKLRASDQEINELFKRFVARPVMVIVDVRPHTVGIPTDAYFAVEEIKDVRFVHSNLNLHRKLIYYLGRYRNTKNIPPRPLRHRSRRSRRNRCRAPPSRHQRLHYYHARYAGKRATCLPARARIAVRGCPKIPGGCCSGDDAREPPDRVPPAGCAEPAP
jgi:hypothetical protein